MRDYNRNHTKMQLEMERKMQNLESFSQNMINLM